MTAIPKKTRSIRTRKDAEPSAPVPGERAQELSMHARLLRFRKTGVPELDDEDTGESYIRKLHEALDKEGLTFLANEIEVTEQMHGFFRCVYEVTLLTENAHEYDVGRFTVIGHPMNGRQIAINMGMVDFAGAAQQMTEALTRSALGVTADTSINTSAAVKMPEDIVAVAQTPEPSPELRAVLEAAASEPEVSKLVAETTPDGLPILRDLFNEPGDPEAVAKEAARVLSDAVSTAPNGPTMRALWDKNADALDYIKDYAPDDFNRMLTLFKERAAVLAQAPQAPVNHPGKTPEAAVGKRRKPRAAQRRAS